MESKSDVRKGQDKRIVGGESEQDFAVGVPPQMEARLTVLDQLQKRFPEAKADEIAPLFSALWF